MSTTAIITFICLILVSGAVTTIVFERLKKWAPKNDGLRSICAYVFSALVALAGSWLAGDVLSILGSWRDGTMDAMALFAYINGIAAASTTIYNIWYKGVKPLVDAGKQNVATLAMKITGRNAVSLADALTKSSKAIKDEGQA